MLDVIAGMLKNVMPSFSSNEPVSLKAASVSMLTL